VSTPAWLAATAGNRALPGQINQLLGAHTSTWLYQGALQSEQATGGTGYQSTYNQWLSQTVTTGAAQTAIGVVYLQVATVGGSLTTSVIAPLVVELYASLGGQPTGSVLATATVNDLYVSNAPYWVAIPLNVTGLAASTPYELVIPSVGTATAYYAWHQSNQTSGAATSSGGTAWASQAYGLMYQAWDQSATGNLQFLYDDDGARWTQLVYNAAGLVTQINEYTLTQSGGVFYSSRALTYSGGSLIGVN